MSVSVILVTTDYTANLLQPCDRAVCRHPGAHLPPAADHEARQVALRHHLRDRAGAARPGALPRRRHRARVRAQDRHLLAQTARLRLLGPLLRLLGAQHAGQGEK